MISSIMSMACICICMIIYTVYSMYHIGIGTGIGISSSHSRYRRVYSIIYQDRPCPEGWLVCEMGGRSRGELCSRGCVGVCCCCNALVVPVWSCE